MVSCEMDVDEAPLVSLPEQGIERTKRCRYPGPGDDRALVIDNGSHSCRIGWSGEQTPRLSFRPVVSRARHRSSGDVLTVVGDLAAPPGGRLAREYDLRSGGPGRSPFDGNVVHNYELQEQVLDYALDRLSVPGNSEGLGHPVVMTEPVANPRWCREHMAELLFEGYGASAVHFGPAAAFAHAHNRALGRIGPDALVVDSGHSATHVLPVQGGRPRMDATWRMSIAGSAATGHLQRLIALAHPQHAGALTPELVASIKEAYCYCARGDYSAEVSSLTRLQSLGVRVQLPFTPPPPPGGGGGSKPQLSPEEEAAEAARKAARKAENVARLRRMGEERRQQQLAEKETELARLEAAQQAAEAAEGAQEREAIIADAGYTSAAAMGKAADALRAAIARSKAAGSGGGAGNASATSLESAAVAEGDGGGRGVPRSWAHDPCGYIAHLRERHEEVAGRVRQRREAAQAAAAEAEAISLAPGGRRGGSERRERMRLLAAAANEKDADEGFGMEDSDWDVYQAMDRNGGVDEEEVAADEAEYRDTAAKLQALGSGDAVVDITLPTGAAAPGAGGASAARAAVAAAQGAAVGGAEVAGVGSAAVAAGPGLVAMRPLTAEDFQVTLHYQRVRPAELLFQPSALAGVGHAGLPEVLMSALRRLDTQAADACAAGGVLLFGGNSMFPSLEERLQEELRALRPLGSPTPVVRSADPMLDAWRGAAALPATPDAWAGAVTRQQYLEGGAAVLHAAAGVRYDRIGA